ncbi:MAG: hypothetical protein PVF83_06620 [Anaerolineales bacterium]|jgi:hypothetical protein
MNTQLLIISALVGWCGTPWPHPWPWPRPEPDPDPWLIKVIGIVGGLLGGWAISQMADASLLSAVVGGWLGSVILSDLYGIARGGLKRG